MNEYYPRECPNPTPDRCCLLSYSWPICSAAYHLANTPNGRSALLKVSPFEDRRKNNGRRQYDPAHRGVPPEYDRNTMDRRK